MARKRMLDPQIWTSESFGRLSLLAKLLLIGCISNADDEGRLKATPAYLKAVILPYGNEKVKDVEAARDEIVSEGSLILYEDQGDVYGYFPTWKVYQNINRPGASKLPDPELCSAHGALSEPSVSPHTLNDVSAKVLSEPSSRIEVKRIEKKRREETACAVVSHFKLKINPDSIETEAAKHKVVVRLGTFTQEQLMKAIDNFSADKWWMEHNSNQPISWFFRSDEQVVRFLNLKPRVQEQPPAATPELPYYRKLTVPANVTERTAEQPAR